ncbi:L-tryptophan--pyruvate aminotransferase 1-like [Impatiens glandulifera]|uniref:L-tryptophan--pyruvate aminotransferase 1-like n=1 Tax=Impatiens glandulifera TaxID=253017 RepID=UPI001FB15255|nr:L-tryptophan--pyruvate aminotransferase 1-like [Impatiens glandulifera]
MVGTEEATSNNLKNTTPNETMRVPSSDKVINLDQGDPTVYEEYWQRMGDKCTVVISGSQSLSYFAKSKSICWFLESALEDSIRQLHRTVGNASADDHYIVVGTGSTQLIMASLYALCPPDRVQPTHVVAATPYYSCYPEIGSFMRSTLYEWAGDAKTYKGEGPFVEFVTFPNNPDGEMREVAVKGTTEGKLVHDLAYYWPQYTPINVCANHDIMLFTLSKCTGHAGSRIGWALVKDEVVARKMIKFMEVTTIGVSKEAQIRAAKILEVVTESCPSLGPENFFQHSRLIMADRWKRLREVVKEMEFFSLLDYPKSYCNFANVYSTTQPAFAWMKSDENKIKDLEKHLKGEKILTRNGNRFGTESNYVRISMLSTNEDFNIFLERMLAMKETMEAVQYNGI